MATKEKTPNYTPEQTEQVKAAYVAALPQGRAAADAVIADFATKFGKTTKSIVAKLTRENVYVAKEYKTKAGETPIKKDAHADAIGRVLKLSEPDTASLAKANKAALAKVFDALANSVPVEIETPEALGSKPELMAQIQGVITLDADEAVSLGRVRASVLAKLAAFLTAED